MKTHEELFSGKLKGKILDDNPLKGKLIEKMNRGLEYKIGDVISDVGLEIQTPAAKTDYSGSFTVIRIDKKGDPSGMKIKGVAPTFLEDDYLVFKMNDGTGLGSVSLTKLKENLALGS